MLLVSKNCRCKQTGGMQGILVSQLQSAVQLTELILMLWDRLVMKGSRCLQTWLLQSMLLRPELDGSICRNICIKLLAEGHMFFQASCEVQQTGMTPPLGVQ